MEIGWYEIVQKEYYHPFTEYWDMPILNLDYEELKRDALFGDLNAIKTAIKNGMDLHFQNDIIMKMAIVHGDTHIMRYLIDNGFIIRERYLPDAIFGGRLRSVNCLLDYKKFKYKLFMIKIPTDSKVREFITKKLKDQSARIIQAACENWLWKPVCKDGSHGIRMRIILNYTSSID